MSCVPRCHTGEASPSSSQVEALGWGGQLGWGRVFSAPMDWWLYKRRRRGRLARWLCPPCSTSAVPAQQGGPRLGQHPAPGLAAPGKCLFSVSPSAPAAQVRAKDYLGGGQLHRRFHEHPLDSLPARRLAHMAEGPAFDELVKTELENRKASPVMNRSFLRKARPRAGGSVQCPKYACRASGFIPSLEATSRGLAVGAQVE